MTVLYNIRIIMRFCILRGLSLAYALSVYLERAATEDRVARFVSVVHTIGSPCLTDFYQWIDQPTYESIIEHLQHSCKWLL